MNRTRIDTTIMAASENEYAVVDDLRQQIEYQQRVLRQSAIDARRVLAELDMAIAVAAHMERVNNTLATAARERNVAMQRKAPVDAGARSAA